ncbi:hypothetical protein ACTWP4_17450 [Gracilibacillus sp. D59]|uniref:hypothetical protein n=1 Tax=Gracilibacillus sp. D59 TaxID=3457434 RepID=UPI003FCD29D0
MNKKNDHLNIQNLSEMLVELQNEVQSIKGDEEKLRFANLIDKLELFISEMNDVTQDVHHLQKRFAQMKRPVTSLKAHYQPSEYSKLQRMFQSVQKDSSASMQNNTNRKWTNPTTEITDVHTNKR